MSPLIGVLVIGLGLAFVLGTAAQRLRLPPLVGYLLAGVAVGPFTPGFVADQHLTLQLAEIGVILLMFGVGLHFSMKDLMSVRAIAVPGASLQMAAVTVLGFGTAWLFDWPLASGLVFGLCLSVASTVVVLRALQDRRLMESERGRIAIGWLVVQDLLTVLALVVLPPVAGAIKGAAIEPLMLAKALALTFGKLAVFAALMLVVGRRVIPAVLHYIAHTGSRELFRLAVLSVALGVAFAAAELFGVSIALGAFFAGMILSGSPLSQRAAEESLPLRDAFAVLFFVSVGMLFNPSVLLREPGMIALTFAVVTVGGGGIAFLMLRLLGQKTGPALVIAVSLAQIGEFSFILADLGIGLRVLPVEARDLILGTSILSILLNPLLFWLATRDRARESAQAPEPKMPKKPVLQPTMLSGHAVLVGFGRVGRLVAQEMKDTPLLVIEEAQDATEKLRAAGLEHIAGNAAQSDVLAAANIAGATMLFVAIPEAFEAGQIVEQARRANPALRIVARAHYDAEGAHLIARGADKVIMGEREIAHAMIGWAMPDIAQPQSA
ncbi:MAG TPA: YbaL family putative K(+) efflux transporter [Rhizomicrobium sp.]|nr:YbaL family putative K(+) efflux transporter [Rhizomicrobium sp.]